jgi:hypothetical protein
MTKDATASVPESMALAVMAKLPVRTARGTFTSVKIRFSKKARPAILNI